MRKPISKEEHAKLAEEIAPFMKGFDFVFDHVIITDENANIIYANKGVERNTGFSAKEMIGKTPGDLWGGKMTKEFYEKMWHTIKIEKKAFVGEVHNVKKDGTEYWQELHISPILDDMGKVRFFIGIEPDISDRKQREKFREEFLSIVGHQLRNPLTTIRWILELLLRKKNLPFDLQGRIMQIYETSQQLTELVSDILALARAERGQMEKNAKDVSLKEMMESLIEEVKLHNPKVVFSFESAEAFPLHVNKTFASQVFSNLIYNAAEYADKKEGKVAVTLFKKDGQYLFSCHNNGPEISQEDKPYIFGKFFRTQDAVQMKKGGTGLGLFIVKTICDNLGWNIWFESNSLQGTTFYVKMPLSKS